ncbi:hypothetical protein [Roseicella sp. DB1501]|uniref:hypothetical protein n=1 Tax=Roseicella sp. DB1501 TaxID=2730925 RepID=UPI001490A2F5|nr:hypothetical protein [Roseicella sp. DB1501]NOG70600.1 hypothetical protein [Roseicella sp. DB1501]
MASYNAISGTRYDDTLEGGAEPSRFLGGAGNDTFVLKAGELLQIGGSGLVDQILDFHGAGSSGDGEQDVLTLSGFGAGSTLTFDHYGADRVFDPDLDRYVLIENQRQQYYRVTDGADATKSGILLVQMADGTNQLTADDYAFTNDPGTGIVFMTGSGNPWGMASYDGRMGLAFGAGAWTKQQGFEASVLSATNQTVYIDGSADQSSAFDSFVAAHRAEMERYVAGGGHLFLNAARLSDEDLDLGFGATLHLDAGLSVISATGHVVDAAGDLANGPAGEAGTDFTGSYFSHDIVTGTGFTTLMTGEYGDILIEKAYGLGTVTIGTLTASDWQSPSPEAGILFANILAHVNDHVLA